MKVAHAKHEILACQFFGTWITTSGTQRQWDPGYSGLEWHGVWPQSGWFSRRVSGEQRHTGTQMTAFFLSVSQKVGAQVSLPPSCTAQTFLWHTLFISSWSWLWLLSTHKDMSAHKLARSASVMCWCSHVFWVFFSGFGKEALWQQWFLFSILPFFAKLFLQHSHLTKEKQSCC